MPLAPHGLQLAGALQWEGAALTIGQAKSSKKSVLGAGVQHSHKDTAEEVLILYQSPWV